MLIATSLVKRFFKNLSLPNPKSTKRKQKIISVILIMTSLVRALIPLLPILSVNLFPSICLMEKLQQNLNSEVSSPESLQDHHQVLMVCPTKSSKCSHTLFNYFLNSFLVFSKRKKSQETGVGPSSFSLSKMTNLPLTLVTCVPSLAPILLANYSGVLWMIASGISGLRISTLRPLRKVLWVEFQAALNILSTSFKPSRTPNSPIVKSS